jgi:hypothetical protein
MASQMNSNLISPGLHQARKEEAFKATKRPTPMGKQPLSDLMLTFTSQFLPVFIPLLPSFYIL